MIQVEVNRVKNVLARKGFLQIGTIVFGITSLVMALLTFYGASAGSFVISIKEKDYRNGIALSETKDMTNVRSRIYADVMNNVREKTFYDIPFGRIRDVDGNYPDTRENYLAYTFYITNNGEAEVDVGLNIDITNESSGVSKAIRIVLIEENKTTIFQKTDDLETVYNYTNLDINNLQVRTFDTNIILDEMVIQALKVDEFKKFSIIIYLEGDDLDCDDALLDGGSLQLKMEFSIINNG